MADSEIMQRVKLQYAAFSYDEDVQMLWRLCTTHGGASRKKTRCSDLKSCAQHNCSPVCMSRMSVCLAYTEYAHVTHVLYAFLANSCGGRPIILPPPPELPHNPPRLFSACFCELV